MSISSEHAEPPTVPTEMVGTINIPVLARICDDTRAAILAYRPPGPWPHLHEISGLLSAFIANEENPKMYTTLDTIRVCRLDRLLEDILEPQHHPRGGDRDANFNEIVAKACKLQKRWEERFGEDYRHLDDVRCREMRSVGRLHGLRFVMDGKPRWINKHRLPDPQASSMLPGM